MRPPLGADRWEVLISMFGDALHVISEVACQTSPGCQCLGLFWNRGYQYCRILKKGCGFGILDANMTIGRGAMTEWFAWLD